MAITMTRKQLGRPLGTPARVVRGAPGTKPRVYAAPVVPIPSTPPTAQDFLPGEAGGTAGVGVWEDVQDWAGGILGEMDPEVNIDTAQVTIDPKTLALIGGALLLLWLLTRKK